MNKGKIPGSFRDPSGFVFKRKGVVYRQVNLEYKRDYDKLFGFGLYKNLVGSDLLIPHQEKSISLRFSDKAYKVLKPEQIPFISYPYEWCFSQLKDAALTTLEIQKKALDFGMSLKDSSNYNIQFLEGKPVLIDILSLEAYKEGKPWVAYRQFCQHFLVPLSLASYRDIRLVQLLRVYIDGIPLDLASSLLPSSTWLNPSLLFHLHLHSKSQKYLSDKETKVKNVFSKRAFLGLIDTLNSAIEGLKWPVKHTNWDDYYKGDSYDSASFKDKQRIVSMFLERINPKNLWDLGANVGFFSRIASEKGINTLSFDSDYSCIELNYLKVKKDGEKKILPLFMDFENPSPGIGWENKERLSFLERGPVDTVLALALIHHLALSNNLPFEKIRDFFGNICNNLVVEFIPKTDPKSKKLLSLKGDIFPEYNKRNFEKIFKKCFKIKEALNIKGSKRILYLMKKK